MVPVMIVYSVVREYETVGCMYMVGGMMDGSHGFCDDGILFCCERV